MKSFGRMPTVRTPEASRYARPDAYWNSAFPFEGKGSATSITFNFEAKFPFTFVSAYCLPVYASQWPLPDNHARLGSWLLAKLYHGSYLKLQNFMRLQGATLTDPCVRNYRTGLFKTARVAPGTYMMILREHEVCAV